MGSIRGKEERSTGAEDAAGQSWDCTSTPSILSAGSSRTWLTSAPSPGQTSKAGEDVVSLS